jgi:hypothetical protein
VGHPNLPNLSHDIALIWTEQGFFDRALAVYQALIPHFDQPEERLRVLAAAIRCAGATSNKTVLFRYWPEAWMIAERDEAVSARAATLLDMGRGAAGLELWEQAADALTWARPPLFTGTRGRGALRNARSERPRSRAASPREQSGWRRHGTVGAEYQVPRPPLRLSCRIRTRFRGQSSRSRYQVEVGPG